MVLDIVVRIMSSNQDIPIQVPPAAKFDDLIEALIRSKYIDSHDTNGKRISHYFKRLKDNSNLEPDSTPNDYQIISGELLLLFTKNNTLIKQATIFSKIGSVALGAGLVILGAVDGIWNPFSFITSPKLLVTGAGLITVGLTGKIENKDKKESDDK